MKYQIIRKPSAKIIYVFSSEGEFFDVDANLVLIEVDDWFSELSPWPYDRYSGNGSQTLIQLQRIMDEVEENIAVQQRYIGGYSLAGLFALYAYKSLEVFDGVFSCSGSLWYQGINDYLEDGALKRGRIYLSLGDKEEKTRMKIMQPVGDNTRRLWSYLKENEFDAKLEMNVGGHFDHPNERMDKAIQWLLRENI